MCKKILFLFLIILFNIDDNVGGEVECITINTTSNITNKKPTIKVDKSFCANIRKSVNDYTITDKQIQSVMIYDTLINKYSTKYKIPINVIVGIWGAESSFNDKSKSPFGIKCYDNTKEKQHLFDDCGDKRCCFERYKSFEQAVELFCVFITNQRNYIDCVNYNNGYVDFKRIANQGYCTDKANWIRNTNSSVKKYNKIKRGIKKIITTKVL